MAEMIPMMSIGCSCLNMLTMMMMAVSSMKMANSHTLGTYFSPRM